MRATWEELNRAAALLGMSNSSDQTYNPGAYRDVYLNVLKHRRCEVLPVDIVLPPNNRSVYDFQVLSQDLAPTPAEGKAFIEGVEQTYPDLAILEEEVSHWYAV
jgi:hypothetical protein